MHLFKKHTLFVFTAFIFMLMYPPLLAAYPDYVFTSHYCFLPIGS